MFSTGPGISLMVSFPLRSLLFYLICVMCQERQHAHADQMASSDCGRGSHLTEGFQLVNSAGGYDNGHAALTLPDTYCLMLVV